MTKRLLVTLLVAAVIIGTVSTAFAASFSDTKGTKYESAVGILSSLGILNGFPDGTFKPGDTITRAQFAKVAVCALGLESAAEYAKGVTAFSDVPATHWAAGFINVAADQGLIKGFPDGTFKPEAPVTYNEAMAIIVRLLGYDPMVKGTWPTNYLVKAAEIGVSEGLSFAGGAPATRGDVALMFENAIAIDMMEQITAGDLIQYVVTDETLLDKLGYDWGESRVLATSDLFESGLEANEVVLWGTWDLADGVNLDDQLGLEVRFWFDDGTVVFAKTLTKSSDIIDCVIEDITADGNEVTIGDKTYDGDGVWCVWNLAFFDWDDIADDDARFEGAEARLVLYGGRIVWLQAMQFEGSVVISDVNTKFERFDAWDDAGGDVRFDLDDYAEARFVEDGAAIDFEDLEELAVAHFFEIGVGGDDYLYVELIDEKVTGEVEEISVDSDDVVTVTVDGEDYTVAGDATMSTDDNDTIDEADEAGMEDFAGNDATLYLNRDGDARHIVGDFVAESESTTAVVKTEFYVVESTDPTDDDQYFVKFFEFDGTTTRCELTWDTKFDGAVVDLGDISTGGGDFYDGNYPEGAMVEFTLDADGKLATVDLIDPDDGGSLDEADIDADGNRLFDYRVTSACKIVDIGEWEVVPWASLEDATFDSACDGTDLYTGGDASLEYCVFDSTSHVVAYDIAEADAGVVLARKVTADGLAIKILTPDGTLQRQVGSSFVTSVAGHNAGLLTDTWPDIDAGEFVTFEYEGDEFSDVSEPWCYSFLFLGLDGYWVEAVDEENLIVTVRSAEDPDGAVTLDLLLDEDCVIYDVTGAPTIVDLEELAVDQYVQAFCTDGDQLVEAFRIIE